MSVGAHGIITQNELGMRIERQKIWSASLAVLQKRTRNGLLRWGPKCFAFYLFIFNLDLFFLFSIKALICRENV